MAVSRQSSADVSLTVAMAVLRPDCTDVSDDSSGCVTPKLYGRIEKIAKVLSRQRCEDSQTVAKAV